MRDARPFSRRAWGMALAGWMMAMPAFAFDPDAPGNGVAPAPPPPAAATPGAPAPGAPPVFPPDMKPTSLFITPAELQKINDAIAAYKRMREQQVENAQNRAKDILNQLEEVVEKPAEPAKPVLFTYPQFYLQTLSYQTQEDWMVMISGEKFMPLYQNPDSWLKVVQVSKEAVMMEWRPQDMDKVNQAWLVAPGGPGQEDVVVDSIRGTVTFTLKPNQTFSSYAMRVLEGKVQPVTVWIQPGGEIVSLSEMPPPQARPKGKGEAGEEDKEKDRPEDKGASKSGLSGLNETYKKMGLEP